MFPPRYGRRELYEIIGLQGPLVRGPGFPAVTWEPHSEREQNLLGVSQALGLLVPVS